VISERARSKERRRLAWGGALIVIALALLFVGARRPMLAPPGRYDTFLLAGSSEAPVVYRYADAETEAALGSVAAITGTLYIARPVFSVAGEGLIVESGLETRMSRSSIASWPWPEVTPAEMLERVRPQIAELLLEERPDLMRNGWLGADCWKAPRRVVAWGSVVLVAAGGTAFPMLLVGMGFMMIRSGTERVYRKLCRGVCPRCGYDIRAVAARCPECGREIADDEAEVVRSSLNRPGA
jgi:hypothetical protein